MKSIPTLNACIISPFEVKKEDLHSHVVKRANDSNFHSVTGRFLHLLPVKFLKTTVIKATNRTLSDPLTAWQELLQFLGLLLLVGTAPPRDPRSSFWANNTPDGFDGLHSNMSRQNFESILKGLKFQTTDSPTPLKHSFPQRSQ
jgi:hypothetical protein